jgi:hypothetical protein
VPDAHREAGHSDALFGTLAGHAVNAHPAPEQTRRGIPRGASNPTDTSTFNDLE